MAAHQAGFENVVASLGTALTRGQIDLALKYGEAIALGYDVDLAGDSAAREGLLAQLGADHSVSKVRIIRIPGGKDPDELIRGNPDAWREAVASAMEVVGFAIDRLASEADMASVGGKRAFTGRALAIIKAIPDPLERNFYVQQLAQRVNVEPGVLAEALQREPVRRPVQRGVPTGPGRQASPAEGGPSGLELEALGLLLRFPALAKETPANGALPFRDATAGALVHAWQERLADVNGVPTAADLEGFVAGLDPASADLARDLLAGLAEGGNDAALDLDAARGVLRVTLLRLREARLEEDLRDGRLLLEEAQRDGDRDRLATIEQRIIQLGREKAEVTRAMRQPADLAGSRRS
jgi:DNA primase